MNNIDTTNPEQNFEGLKLKPSYKNETYGNPIFTQRFGADPWAMEYNDTLYVYMTGDLLEKESDGSIKDNSYSKVNTINVLSTKDMVNWTDCGAIKVAGPNGAAHWCNQSWAPAMAHKKIDGKEKFFLYFAAGGNGVGVLTSDSPTGPFTDPLGHALISRSVPTCAEVTWLFDPAVLVDDDGKGYLYFGGGIPGNNSDSDELKKAHQANPGTARAVQLGDDMISIIGTPIKLEVPYLFEDSGINKFNNTYYYSYCTNWNIPEDAKRKLNIGTAHIAYMTSKNPLGPFTLQKSFLKNPGEYFGTSGNNHHCIFTFRGERYIAYHAFTLQDAMLARGGYRSTNIDKIIFTDDGSINMVDATKKGIPPLRTLTPYTKTSACTIASQGGITTSPATKEIAVYGSGEQIVTDIKSGEWIMVRNIDFGSDGATSFSVQAKNNSDNSAIIKIALDSLESEAQGYCLIPSSKDYNEHTCILQKKITGIHDVYFIFAANGFDLKSWQFNH